MSYHVMSYHIISCHIMSNHIMSCHVMSGSSINFWYDIWVKLYLQYAILNTLKSFVCICYTSRSQKGHKYRFYPLYWVSSIFYQGIWCNQLVQFSTVQFSSVLYCTALYYTALYCIVLHCTALYCTALYCSILFCSVLFYSWFYLILRRWSVFPMLLEHNCSLYTAQYNKLSRSTCCRLMYIDCMPCSVEITSSC